MTHPTSTRTSTRTTAGHDDHDDHDDHRRQQHDEGAPRT